MEEKFSRIDAILAKVQVLLSGEPLRALGYTLGIAIFVIAKAFRVIPDESLDQSLLQAAAALTALASIVETARHLVYSPSTVERVEDQAFTEGVRQGSAISRSAPDDTDVPDVFLGHGEPVAEEPTVSSGDARVEALPTDTV